MPWITKWESVDQYFLRDILKAIKEKMPIIAKHKTDGVEVSEPASPFPRLESRTVWCPECKVLDVPIMINYLIICPNCAHILSTCIDCGIELSYHGSTTDKKMLPMISCPKCHHAYVYGISDLRVKIFPNPIDIEDEGVKESMLFEHMNATSRILVPGKEILELKSQLAKQETKYHDMEGQHLSEEARLNDLLDSSREELTKFKTQNQVPVALDPSEITVEESEYTVFFSGRLYGIAKKKKQIEQIEAELARKGFRYDQARRKPGKVWYD